MQSNFQFHYYFIDWYSVLVFTVKFNFHTTAAGVILQRNSRAKGFPKIDRSRAPPDLLAMSPTAALAECNSLEEIEKH